MNEFVTFFTKSRELGQTGLSLSILDLLLHVVLPIVGLVVLYRLLLLLVRRVILRPLKIKEETRERAYRYVRLAFRILFIIGVVAIVARFLGSQLARQLSLLWGALNTPILDAGSSRITVVTLFLTIPVFYVASWLARVTIRFVDSAVLGQLTVDDSVKLNVSRILRYTTLIVVAMIGLSMIGINLSSIAVIFGVLGIGIGFGLQNTVGNFFAGLVLFFERPLREGDRIRVGDIEGDVQHIRLRSTVITTLTNETIIVPNGHLSNSIIHNYSYFDRRIIVVNSVQVAYGTDLDAAEAALLRAVSGCPYALPAPEPQTLIREYQDSGILVELRTWIADASKKLEALSWLNRSIWHAFEEAGIVIPFPQRDVHHLGLTGTGAEARES